MITSEQISALIAVQQQQARAMQNPQMLGMPMPVPGPSQYPPQFDFGLRGQGAMSTAGAHVAMAGIGAIPPALSGMGLAAGNIQGIGWMGHMAGIGAGTGLMNSPFLTGMSRLDPISAMALGAFNGGGAAWGMGAGAVGRGALGGALGMGGLMNPITLGAMSASFGIGQMHRGFSDQQGLNGQLSGMQFMNSGAHFGRGFSSANMMQFGNAVRSIDAADPFTTMRDMTGMLGKFNEMGMGQTSRDADEFTRKFKAMAETVRTLAKTMGTTIDEASQTFSGLRQAGIYSARDVIGAGTQIKTLGTMGMSSDQAMGLMQTGAGISRSMDMRGRAGSRAASGLAESLLTASQLGSFSGEEMMDATGAPDVTTAASQMSLSMTSKLASFLAGSSVGQATLATVGEKEHGKYTGHVDMGQLEGILSGKTGVKDLSSMGRGRLAGKDAGLSFTVKNRDIAAGLLEQDPMAVTGILMNSIRDRHPEMDEEGLFKYTMEHMVGLDRRETEIAAKMFKEYEATRRERNRKRMQEVQQAMSELDVKQSHTIEGWKQHVSGAISDAFSPMRAFGAQMGTDFERTSQRVSDTLMGRTRFTSNEATRGAVLRDVMAGKEMSSGSIQPSNLGVIPELQKTMGLAGAISANAGVASGDFSALEKEFSNDPEAMKQIRAAAEYIRNNGSLRQAAIEKGEGALTTRDTLGMAVGMRMSGLAFTGGAQEKKRSALALSMHLAGYDALGGQVAGLTGLTGNGGGIAASLEESKRQEKMAVMFSMSIQGMRDNTRWYDTEGTSGTTLAGRALDDLQEGGGMSVIAAMQGKMTPQELRDWEAKNKGMSPDDRAAALGEKLGISGLTAGNVSAARQFLKQTSGKGQKDMLGKLTDIEKSMQYSADSTGLVTAMGRAGKGSKFAEKDFRALQTSATRAAMGDPAAGLGTAMDSYLAHVQELSPEEMGDLAGSGDFGAMVSQIAMRRKKMSGAHSVKDLKGMGVTDDELKQLGLTGVDTLSTSQASEVATQISRRDLAGSVQSSGGIYTGTTESTQVQLQLAQQMTMLADANKKFVETVGVLVASQKGTSTSLGNKPTTPVIGVPTPEHH